MKKTLLFILLMLVPVWANATTYYVSSAGADTNNGTTTGTSFAHAPGMAGCTDTCASTTLVAGDSVLFNKGDTWAHQLTVPTSGSSGVGNTITFGAYGTGNQPVINAGGSIGIYVNAKDYITIDGLRVTGSTYLVLITADADNVTVKNCTLDTSSSDCVNTSGATTIVENNIIDACWNGSAYGGGGVGDGIKFASGSANGIARYNKITNSYLGIRMDGASDIQVYYNLVENSKVNGIDHTNGVSGHPNLVYNNTVIHNPQKAGAAGHGIDAQSSGDFITIKNNIIYMNYDGTATNVQAIAIESSAYTTVDLDYNLVYKAPGNTAEAYKLDTTTYNTLAAWQTALAGTSFSGKAAHDVLADPLFVAPPLTEESGGIFTSGFEDEVDAMTTDFTSKTSTPTNAAAITTAAGTINNGAKAVKFTFDGTNTYNYITKTISDATTLYVRMYFKVNAGFIFQANYKYIELLSIRDGATLLADVNLGVGTVWDSLKTYFRTRVPSGEDTYAGTAGEVSLDAWHYIEVYFTAGTGANGTFTYWLDGVQKGTRGSLNLTSYAVDTINIGSGPDFGTTNPPSSASELYVDDVRMTTTGPIGVFNGLTGTDLHLTPSSPAINAGTNVSLTTDYAGNRVPCGSAPDMGAYELCRGGIVSKSLSFIFEDD